MKIALILHEDTRTGAPIVGCAVRDVLVVAGHDVVVVVRHRGVGDLLIDEPEVVSEPDPLGRKLLHRAERRRLGRGTGRVSVAVARQVLREVAPDVVYANSLATASYARAAVSLGIPAVVHSHELAVVGAYFATRARLAQCAGRGVVFCATSHAAATDLAFMADTLPEDVRIVRPPVEVAERPSPTPKRALVGSMGLVDLWKGPDLFLDVMERVHAVNPDAEGVWFGTGSMLGEFQARAGRASVTVRFPGSVRESRQALREMAVFALTSRLESLSLVAAEAMAEGVPVVAFDVGGVREVVGDAGVLIAPGDTVAMASSVASLLASTEQRRKLGSRGQDRVDVLFSPDLFRERVLALLEEALGGS